jgi:predicted helicase
LSVQLINQYYTKCEKLIQFGGSKNELSIRDAFKDLLNHYSEKFNTYRFADYKEHIIELLKKVTTVSVETMKIIREMEKEK